MLVNESRTARIVEGIGEYIHRLYIYYCNITAYKVFCFVILFTVTMQRKSGTEMTVSATIQSNTDSQTCVREQSVNWQVITIKQPECTRVDLFLLLIPSHIVVHQCVRYLSIFTP